MKTARHSSEEALLAYSPHGGQSNSAASDEEWTFLRAYSGNHRAIHISVRGTQESIAEAARVGALLARIKKTHPRQYQQFVREEFGHDPSHARKLVRLAKKWHNHDKARHWAAQQAPQRTWSFSLPSTLSLLDTWDWEVNQVETPQHKKTREAGEAKAREEAQVLNAETEELKDYNADLVQGIAEKAEIIEELISKDFARTRQIETLLQDYDSGLLQEREELRARINSLLPTVVAVVEPVTDPTMAAELAALEQAVDEHATTTAVGPVMAREAPGSENGKWSLGLAAQIAEAETGFWHRSPEEHGVAMAAG